MPQDVKKSFATKFQAQSQIAPNSINSKKLYGAGDTVVVYKLDRLGRSLKHLIETIAEFDKQEVLFKSISDPIDTTSAQGRLIFNIFASLSEFERELIRERTNAGLQSARARGRLGGRPKGLSEEAENKARICESLYNEGRLSANEIARNQSISKATLYKYLRHRGVQIGPYNKAS